MSIHSHIKDLLIGLSVILALSIEVIGQPFELDQNLSDSLTNSYNGDVLWGDFDNDGDLDILMGGSAVAQPILEMYKNEGTSFVKVDIGFTGFQNLNLSWCDYDSDNDLDFLLLGTEINGYDTLPSALLFENLGNDSFESFEADLLGVYDGKSAWGDLDNDGDQDLLIIGDKGEAGITRIYKNNQGLEFELMDHGLSNVYKGDVALGDYDNDMDLDILMIGVEVAINGSDNKILKIYRNEGNFNFTGVFGEFVGMSESCLQWADYDSDGDLDILANGSTEAPTHLVYLYQNLNNDSFLNIGIEIFGTVNGSAVWGDYDVDGDFDFLLTGMPSYGNDPITEIYRNINVNLFNKDDNVELLEVQFSSNKWGDYDCDGDLDILMSGLTSLNPEFETLVYRNQTANNNTKPSSPTYLQSTLNDNSVFLNWAKSSDVETMDEGLTYNLRIGTSPGAGDIISPLSTQNGDLLIPALGNVNHNTSWKINQLPPGIYYWSVQAVDNSFKGSEFANEEWFEVVISNTWEDELTVNSNEPIVNLYPNPFRDKITFEITTIKNQNLSAYIMDLSGHIVRNLTHNRQNDRELLIEWNGESDRGEVLEKGLYYIVLEGNETRNVRKVMLIN